MLLIAVFHILILLPVVVYLLCRVEPWPLCFGWFAMCSHCLHHFQFCYCLFWLCLLA